MEITYKKQQEILENFSKQIKRIRKNSNDSQKSFCEKYDINLRTLKNWEGKKALPTWETVVQLSDALNVSIDYFADRHIDKATSFLQGLGLSEQAIGVIMNENNRNDIICLSKILENSKFHVLIHAMTILIQEN